MTQKEAISEIHDRVRQCFTRHQFKTFGDALHWLHNEDFEIIEMEAGEQGYSKFSTNILWMIGQFGPKSQVDHTIMDVRKVPALKPVKVIHEPDDEKEITVPPKASKPRKIKKRKTRKF